MRQPSDLFYGARWALWARAVLALAFAGLFLNDPSIIRNIMTGLLAYLLLIDGLLGVLRFLVHPRPAWWSAVWPNLVWITSVIVGLLILLQLQLRPVTPRAHESALMVLYGLSALTYAALAWRTRRAARYALAGWSAWLYGVLVFLLLVPRGEQAQVWQVAPLGLVALACAAGMIAALIPAPRENVQA